MKSRQITESDYDLINSWCRDWRFPEIAQGGGTLPELGLVISDDEGNDICSGFIYLTDSIFAHPEWIISNRNYKNKQNRRAAITLLFQELTEHAKSRGRTVMLLSVKNPSLMKLLEEIGFFKTDTNMTNLIKIL